MADNTHTQILIAGAAAAFTIDLLVYPLDTIKTRYQSQDYLKTFASSTSATSKKIPGNAFKGLYQGVGSVIVATLPAAGVFFTTYEAFKPIYARVLHDGVPQPVVHSLASGTAELASCVILTPAEVIKQNAQMLRQGDSPTRGRSTSTEVLRMLWRSEGGPARRLWTGYTALAARNLPFTAMQFPMFEYARGKIWEWRERRRAHKVGGQRVGGATRSGEELQIKLQDEHRAAMGVTSIVIETGLVTGASAAASGSIAAVITTPTDVIKTRMMLSAGKARGAEASGASGHNSHVDGTPDLRRAGRQGKQNGLDVARLVFQEKGVKGLFRGGLLRAGWTALGSGLYLGTYEMAKVWLKGGGEKARDDVEF